MSENTFFNHEANINSHFFKELNRVGSFTLLDNESNFFSLSLLGYASLKKESSFNISQRKKYDKVSTSIVELYQCITALFYHINNVKEIEKEIANVIGRYEGITICADGGVFRADTTSRFDFEYHAFSFASVRCIYHVFKVIGNACFNKRLNGKRSFVKSKKIFDEKFRKLSSPSFEEIRIYEAINNLEKLMGRYSILEKLYKLVNDDGGVDKKSIRDIIAHDNFLNSGNLLITENEIKLRGNLPLDIERYDEKAERNVYKLSEIMINQAEHIKNFSVEVIELLIELDFGRQIAADHLFENAKSYLNYHD